MTVKGSIARASGGGAVVRSKNHQPETTAVSIPSERKEEQALLLRSKTKELGASRKFVFLYTIVFFYICFVKYPTLRSSHATACDFEATRSRKRPHAATKTSRRKRALTDYGLHEPGYG